MWIKGNVGFIPMRIPEELQREVIGINLKGCKSLYVLMVYVGGHSKRNRNRNVMLWAFLSEEMARIHGEGGKGVLVGEENVHKYTYVEKQNRGVMSRN